MFENLKNQENQAVNQMGKSYQLTFLLANQKLFNDYKTILEKNGAEYYLIYFPEAINFINDIVEQSKKLYNTAIVSPELNVSQNPYADNYTLGEISQNKIQRGIELSVIDIILKKIKEAIDNLQEQQIQPLEIKQINTKANLTKALAFATSIYQANQYQTFEKQDRDNLISGGR